MAVYFTSDTHFGDPRVLRIDRRPFGSIEEHDAALAENWNRVVGPKDVVWHLGDFAFSKKSEQVEELLAALNGVKHLIIGNNDAAATISSPSWQSHQHYAELVVDGRQLVLCHYPFRTWNKMGRGVINLHGHSHGKLTPVPRQYDVGVDARDYTPATLASICQQRRAGSRKRAGR